MNDNHGFICLHGLSKVFQAGSQKSSVVYPSAVRSGSFQAAGGAPVPWLSQSPEAAARAILRGIKKDWETIYTPWILLPLLPPLLVNYLLPFARRRYQAPGGRVQRRHWADQAKSESNHER